MGDRLTLDGSLIGWLERWTPTPWGQMYSRSSLRAGLCETPIILVPGMIISSRYMIPLGELLARRKMVHTIDFPGFGRSEKPKDVLGVRELSEALRIWMVSNDISKATIVANSFGCQIAAEFSARHPEMVENLVLQGPTVDASARNFFRQMFRLKINSWRESKSVGIISIQDYRAAGLERVVKTIHMTLKDHIEDKLPFIKAKTLVVRGSLDPVVPEAWAEIVTRLIPHAELYILKGGAHTLNYSEPEAFAESILRFLSKKNGKDYDGK